jgi:hypothetical protein
VAPSPAADFRPQQPELVLELRNERPISVGDLSELLGSLARDYRQISHGHELVVVRLFEGSLIAFFRDASELAGGVNDLIEFGKTVASVLSGALGGLGAAVWFRGRKKVGARTVESLTKIAAASDSRVELRYKGVEGDRLFLRITPSEARHVQEVIAEATRPGKTTRSGRANRMKLPQSSDMHDAEVDESTLGEFRAALTQLAERTADGQQADSDVEELLKAFVEVLRRNRMAHLLTSVMQDLEARGQLEAARRLRAIMDSGPTGGASPPLLT